MFFKSGKKVIEDIYNPLKITRSSTIEFSGGKLRDTGIYRFGKIVEIETRERIIARYVIFDRDKTSEYVFEVIEDENEELQAYLFELIYAFPFHEDFLKTLEQGYAVDPEGREYRGEIRADGIRAAIRVYDVETGRLERETGAKIWIFERMADGETEYLNIELTQDTGMFRLFRGESVDDVFYKFYQGG